MTEHRYQQGVLGVGVGDDWEMPWGRAGLGHAGDT